MSVTRLGKNNGIAISSDGSGNIIKLQGNTTVSGDATFNGETTDNYMLWDKSLDRLKIYTTGSSSSIESLQLIHTDTDANKGPGLSLRRMSNDALNDILGQVSFSGDDDGGSENTYSSIRGQVGAGAGAMAAGAEEGALNLIAMSNGTSRSAILIKGTASDTVDVDIGYGAASKTEVKGYFSCNSVTAIAAPTYTATSQTARNADTATADAAIQDVLQTLIADLIATGILQSS